MAKPFNYKSALKTMRGKIGFDYDLRKKLNNGQKAAIRRAYGDFVTYKNQRFIKPPKHRGETKPAYLQRLREIQKSLGQEGNNWQGFFINMPKEARYRIKEDGLIHWWKKNGSGRTVSETFVPVSGPEIANDPGGFAQEIFTRFGPFRRVFFNHNGFRSNTVLEGADLDDEETFADVMEAFFEELERRYKNTSQALGSITGIIIQH